MCLSNVYYIFLFWALESLIFILGVFFLFFHILFRQIYRKNAVEHHIFDVHTAFSQFPFPIQGFRLVIFTTIAQETVWGHSSIRHLSDLQRSHGFHPPAACRSMLQVS